MQMAVLLIHITAHVVLDGEEREQLVASLRQVFKFHYPDVHVQKMVCSLGIIMCREEWKLTKVMVTAL